jgi:sugar phosphate permease
VVLAVPTLILTIGVLALPVPAHPAPRDPMPLWRYILKLGKLFFNEGHALLRIRTLRWLIVSSTAMAFAAGGFNAWLLDFLQRDKGMTRGDATTVLSIAMVGAVAGIIVGGRVADRLRTKYVAGRLWTIVIGMTLAIPCTIISLEVGQGALLVIAGTANFFFFSWYHAPIAASVDDLAPAAQAVAAQGLVIFMMHLVGTSSSSYVVGLVSDHTSLYTAMWVPTGALVVAAITMVAATSSFAGDHLRARSPLTRSR